MKVKSLVLGSAAAILAVTGAQAADLPIAEPVEYVRICDTYGTGFFYIPGTETCLRISGIVRAELRYSEPEFGGRNPAWNAAYNDQIAGTNIGGNRDENHTVMRARAYFRADARTQTEYGLLRTYFDIWWTHDSGGTAGTTLRDAFVQFGGFTAGRAPSLFDYFAKTAGHWGAINDGAYSSTRTNLFAYTFALGNGLSASLAVEDGTFRRTVIYGPAARTWTPTWGGPVPVITANTASWLNPDWYGGHVVPDVVANVRIDQGWGSAQIAAALHQIRPTNATTQNSRYGYALMAGLQVNLPMIAAGDYFTVQGVYSEGAPHYAGISNGSWQGVPIMDAYITAAAGGAFQLTTAWSVAASFVHNWSPEFYTSITGTYIDVDNPVGWAINNGGLAGPGITGDWSAWNVFLVNAWTPVSGLIIGVEVGYENVDVNGAPNCSFNALCDYDRWSGVFRVQRSW